MRRHVVWWSGCLTTFAFALAWTTPVSPQAQPARPSTATITTSTALTDESKVPTYTLPDPLRLEHGERVTDVRTWNERRRPQLIHLFETQVFGRSAHGPTGIKFIRRNIEREALGGLATRKEVTVLFTGMEDGPRMDLLIYVPNKMAGKKPAFLGLNFGGNHTVHKDPAIALPIVWRPSEDRKQVVGTRATDDARGSAATSWPVELILSRGFALVTAYYGDVEPDHPAGWSHGVRAKFSPVAVKELTLPPKATKGEIDALAAKVPKEHGLDKWGAIGAWAWALSRALDYIQTDDDLDGARVALIGHSRLGKTALWAGALDQRFAMVVANESGEGGAAITRRRFGETLARITTAFPHWFCGMYTWYQDREDDLPIDFNELTSLIAPRPLYVASAAEDLWADPRGEFLGAKGAEPVYRLFGKEGLGVDDMPALETPVGKTIGYHIRRGKHDLTPYDWEQYLAFAGRHLTPAK